MVDELGIGLVPGEISKSDISVTEVYKDKGGTELDLGRKLLRSDNPTQDDIRAVTNTFKRPVASQQASQVSQQAPIAPSAPVVSVTPVVPAAAVAPVAKVAPRSRIVGFLVSYDNEENGEITELRVGRWVVTSQYSVQENILCIEDPSVSSMHAIIKVSANGEVQVIDQLSEKGSGILRTQTGQELDASEAPVKAQHGDLLRFGNRYFVYCSIPKIQIEN
jgi:FHA domain